jgi:hypothetical protein
LDEFFSSLQSVLTGDSSSFLPQLVLRRLWVLNVAGTGIRLAQAGYAVFGLDVEGHGKSDGLQAYIPSFNNIVDDTISYFKSVRGLFIHLLNHSPRAPIKTKGVPVCQMIWL